MTKIKFKANININHIKDIQISDPSKLSDTKLYTEKVTKELLNVLSSDLEIPENDIKIKVKYEVMEDDEDIMEIIQERLENDNGDRLTTEEIVNKRSNK